MKYKNKKLFASILLAAGNSQRLGLNIAKQFCLLKDNLSVLEISLKNISPFAENIIITLPVSEIQNLELQNKLKVIAQNFKTNLFFISGGQNRFESVLKAFEIIKDGESINAIPNSGEKFMTFSIGNLKFIDSFQFMAFSLDKLVKGLTAETGDPYAKFTFM